MAFSSSSLTDIHCPMSQNIRGSHDASGSAISISSSSTTSSIITTSIDALPDSLLVALLSFCDLYTRSTAAACLNKRFRHASTAARVYCHQNIQLSALSHPSSVLALAWLQNAVHARQQQFIAGTCKSSHVSASTSSSSSRRPSPAAQLFGLSWADVTEVSIDIPQFWSPPPSPKLVTSMLARLAEHKAPLSRLTVAGVRLDFSTLCRSIQAWRCSLQVADFASVLPPFESADERDARLASVDGGLMLRSFNDQHSFPFKWLHSLGDISPWVSALMSVSSSPVSGGGGFTALHSLQLPPLPSASVALVALASLRLRHLSLAASSVVDGEGDLMAQALSTISAAQCALVQSLQSLWLIVDESSVDRGLMLSALDLPEFSWFPLLPACVRYLPLLCELVLKSCTLTDDRGLISAFAALEDDTRLSRLSLDICLPISAQSMQSIIMHRALSNLVLRNLYTAEHSKFVEMVRNLAFN